MTRKALILVLAGLVPALTAVSCAYRDAALPEVFSVPGEPARISSAAPAASPGPVGRSAPKAEVMADLVQAADTQVVDASAGRKLVYEASLTVEAREPAALEAFMDAAVEAAGGYVSRRSADGNSIYLQVRIPVDKLEVLMDALAGQGRVLGRSLSAEDVTDRYFDLEGRLRNKRLLEARFRTYLEEAASLEEILQVERNLSELTNEIEWLEGSFRELGKRIELATLSVSIRPVYTADSSRPTLGQSLRRLVAGFGEGVRILVLVLAGLLLYGIPALLVLAGLWWLAFGKLGLVRRLFTLAGKGGKTRGSGP